MPTRRPLKGEITGMKSRITAIVMFLMMASLLLGLVSGCAPGGAPPPIPGNQTPPDTGTGGGDPREPQYYGTGQLLPETLQYGDLVDVAVNEDFIYVLDTTTVYAFTKSGILINTVNVPVAPAKGIAVIPDNPRIPAPGQTPYLFAKHVAVSHTPGPGLLGGCVIAIYGPNLDDLTTVEDQVEPNRLKRFDLPRYYLDADLGQPEEMTVPNVTQVTPPPPIFRFYETADVIASRDGALVLKSRIWFEGVPPPLPSDRVTVFHPEVGGQGYHMYFPLGHNVPAPEGIPEVEEGTPIGVPWFHMSLGDQVGPGTKIALSSFYPNNRADTINFYCADSILTRDYVGVGQFFIDNTTVPTSYSFSAPVGNPLGWSRVIGQSYGSGPGSFAINPPINPVDGTLEDPDLDAGGPAGIGIDPRNDNVYICDPGNRRVQIFDKNGIFLRQIGDGSRGTSGNQLIAPSSVTVDLDGTVYICDTNILRIFRESTNILKFGNLAGTVRNTQAPNPIPLPDTVITIANTSGVVATALTDINGQYRVENLLIGNYYVVANKFQYESDNTSVTILPDETVIANFNLFPQFGSRPGHITGTILDSVTNLALEGVVVSVVGTSISTISDANGSFTINDIEAGDWQLRFDLERFNTTYHQVHVLRGTTTNIFITMTPLLA